MPEDRLTGIRVSRLSRLWPTAAAALFMAAASTPAPRVSITTHHNDQYRTGANPNETVLRTANVNVAQFGKAFSRALDGHVYAQPLYVAGLEIPGRGRHNVVYVSTEHNSVYAFDADDPEASKPLWQTRLGTPVPAPVIGSIRDIVGEIGISSTPVIDLAANILYVVAETYEGGEFDFRLHALDIVTGRPRVGRPAEIHGDVPGSGIDATDGRIAFNPRQHWQRPGLLLSNGRLFVAFGSHQDDQPFHGWVFSFEAATLRPTAVLCTSPDSRSGGIWQSGVGLAADGRGSIYAVTGDGRLTAHDGGLDLGDSVLKLSERDLSVFDFFSPSDQAFLSRTDRDFGTIGAMLIPGTSLLLTGAKDGRVFVLDGNNLGQFRSPERIVQTWQGSNQLFGAGVYYNSILYGGWRGDRLKAFRFDGSKFTTTPASQTAFAVAEGFANGPALSLSANGTTPGTAILWATYSMSGQAGGPAYPGILRALDATDLSRELWNSEEMWRRDSLGSWAKWVPPTVANGKVYVATFDHRLNVYGLLDTPAGN